MMIKKVKANDGRIFSLPSSRVKKKSTFGALPCLKTRGHRHLLRNIFEGVYWLGV